MQSGTLRLGNDRNNYDYAINRNLCQYEPDVSLLNTEDFAHLMDKKRKS